MARLKSYQNSAGVVQREETPQKLPSAPGTVWDVYMGFTRETTAQERGTGGEVLLHVRQPHQHSRNCQDLGEVRASGCFDLGEVSA